MFQKVAQRNNRRFESCTTFNALMPCPRGGCRLTFRHLSRRHSNTRFFLLRVAKLISSYAFTFTSFVEVAVDRDFTVVQYTFQIFICFGSIISNTLYRLSFPPPPVIVMFHSSKQKIRTHDVNGFGLREEFNSSFFVKLHV